MLLIYFEYNFLITNDLQIFSPMIVFSLLDGVISTNIFNFDKVQFSIFSFITCAFDAVSKKPLPNPSLKRCILMFSSKIFIVLAPKFWSRIYFELIFVYAVR